MIRILQILNGMNYGGMESMLMNYYRNINKDKIIFDFLVFTDGKNAYEDEIIRGGGRIYKITSRRKNPIKNYYELNNFFKNHNEYSIVQIHQGITYFAPLIFAWKFKVPIRIVHSHGIDYNLKNKHKWLYKKAKIIISKLATHFFACSESAAKELFTSEILTKNQYQIMTNAIDLEKLKFDSKIRDTIRSNNKFNDFELFVNVGRISYQKNGLFLIDVFNEIQKFKPNSILLFIGGEEDTEYKDKMLKKISRYNLSEKVIFTGAINNVNEYLMAADYFLMPSLFEGLPVAGIEAQASGLNCIFSNTITRELKVLDNVWFCSIENVSEWVKCIEKFSNTNRYEDFEVVSKSVFNIKDSANTMTKYYLDIYNDLGGKK